LKTLEKENKLLKSSACEKEKVADLVEKNKALTEWRRQLVEKNQNLVKKLDRGYYFCNHKPDSSI